MFAAEETAIKQHRIWADKEFTNHIVTCRLNCGLYRNWRCATPGSSAYSFNIITEPGRLIVTGDLGVLVLERTDDMIPWCRRSLNSIDYFAEKVPHEIKTRVYSPAVAREWLEAMLADPATTDKFREAFEYIDVFNEHDVISAVIESEIDTDGLDFDIYTPSFLWCREAVRWFLANAFNDQPSWWRQIIYIFTRTTP